MSDCDRTREIAPENRKYFEFSADGKEELTLFLSPSSIEHLRDMIDYILENIKLIDDDTGYYITYRGTFR